MRIVYELVYANCSLFLQLHYKFSRFFYVRNENNIRISCLNVAVGYLKCSYGVRIQFLIRPYHTNIRFAKRRTRCAYGPSLVSICINPHEQGRLEGITRQNTLIGKHEHLPTIRRRT